MDKIFKAYLSGGMEYAQDEGQLWRKEIESWLELTLGHKVFNPNNESKKFFKQNYPGINFRNLKYSNINLYQKIVHQLIDIDIKEIANHTDYVICFWDESAEKGAGTKGEITIAKFLDKPVYLVTSLPFSSIPGWVIGCSTKIFKNFDELKSFLLSIYSPNNI